MRGVAEEPFRVSDQGDTGRTTNIEGVDERKMDRDTLVVNNPTPLSRIRRQNIP